MNSMKSARSSLLVALFLCAGGGLFPTVADASEVGNGRRFGLGGMIGAPTGLSMKLYFNARHALDFGVGVGFLNGNAASVHVDYLFHFMLNRNRRFDLPLYVGIGGQVRAFFDEGYHGYFGGGGPGGGHRAPPPGAGGVALLLPPGAGDNFLPVLPPGRLRSPPGDPRRGAKIC